MLSSKGVPEGSESSLGCAVRGHQECGNQRQKRSCDDHAGGIVFLLKMRQKLDGEVHNRNVVDFKFVVESIEINLSWSSKLGLSLGSRVEEDAVQVGICFDNPTVIRHEFSI